MPNQVQPIDYRPGPNGPVPIYNNASPGVGGAIQDAIRALAMAFAPKSVTQAPARQRQQQETAETGSPQTTDLGQQF